MPGTRKNTEKKSVLKQVGNIPQEKRRKKQRKAVQFGTMLDEITYNKRAPTVLSLDSIMDIEAKPLNGRVSAYRTRSDMYIEETITFESPSKYSLTSHICEVDDKVPVTLDTDFMSAVELRRLCKEWGLPATGNKYQLKARVERNIRSNEKGQATSQSAP